jgi:hypothetical protein
VGKNTAIVTKIKKPTTPGGVPVAISKTPNAIGPKIIKEIVVALFMLQFIN